MGAVWGVEWGLIHEWIGYGGSTGEQKLGHAGEPFDDGFMGGGWGKGSSPPSWLLASSAHGMRPIRNNWKRLVHSHA